MVRFLKDYVNVGGRWYASGMTAEQVGDDAGRISDYAWQEAGSGAVDAPAPPPPPAPEVTPVDVVEPEDEPDTEDPGAAGGAGEITPAAPASVDPDGVMDDPKAPPLAGPKGSAKAWREYAAKQGVEVPQDAKRDDVIAALREAGKPVD